MADKDIQTPQPLFNDLVLSKIFANLPLKSLLNCRLVCTTWALNSEITQRIAQSVTVTLNSYDKLDAFLRFLEEWDNGGGEEEQRRPVPFRKLDLQFTAQCHTLCDGDHVVSGEEEEQGRRGKAKLTSLFDSIQGLPFHLKYLKLTLDKTHFDIDGLKRLLFDSLTVTSHLHTLYIYNLSHRAVLSRSLMWDEGMTSSRAVPNFTTNTSLRRLIIDEIRIPIPDFMSDLFKVFVNLTELVLKCDKRSDWENQTGIWKEHSPLATSVIQGLLAKCQEDEEESLRPGELKIKLLHCGVLDAGHFLSLTELGRKGRLQLQELEIYCPARDVVMMTIQEFLETQSSSLKTLRVLGNVEKLRRSVGSNGNTRISGTMHNFMLTLPQKMKQLEEFQLSGRDKDTPISILPIAYGTQLPKLKRLTVNGFATNILGRMVDYFPSFWAASSLTVRKVILPAEIRDPLFPALLIQLFPNLLDLEVKYPNNNFLNELFCQCRNLASLTVLCEATLSVVDGFVGTVGFPGIRNLKKLTKLEIVVETEEGVTQIAIGDSVILEALLEMSQLRKLTLLGCCWLHGPHPCNFISEECKQQMVRTLEDCVVILSPVVENIGCFKILSPF